MKHRFKKGDRVRILSFDEIIPDDSIPPTSAGTYLERRNYFDLSERTINKYSKFSNLYVSRVLKKYSTYDTSAYILSKLDDEDEDVGEELFYTWHESMLDYAYPEELEETVFAAAEDDILSEFLRGQYGI